MYYTTKDTLAACKPHHLVYLQLADNLEDSVFAPVTNKLIEQLAETRQLACYGGQNDNLYVVMQGTQHYDEVMQHCRDDVGTAWRNEEILQHLQCVLFDDSCALHLGVVVAGSSGEGCNEYQPGVSVQVTKQHLMEYFDEYGTENHTLCYHGDYYTVAYTGD